MVGQVKYVYKRGGPRFRMYRKSWSYRRRRHQGHLILSAVRNQGLKPTCIYNALCGIIEAKLCMKGIFVKLSVDALEEMATAWISTKSGSKPRSSSSDLALILQNLARRGIPTDEDYKKGCLTGPKYKITSCETLSWFKFTTAAAVRKLRENGPLLAIIKMSGNFARDFMSGSIYRFDKDKALVDGAQTRTHAVISTGYVIDDILPFWEMQNSHDLIGEEKGFGYFDFDSLVHLFSINV